MKKEVANVLDIPESWLDKVFKNATWLIIVLGLGVQFFYNTMVMEKPVLELLVDWKVWVSTFFTLFLHLTIIGSAIDKSILDSLEHPKFKMWDEKNDIIIGDIRNNQEAFYDYIQKLNAHEKAMVQKTYFINNGILNVSELNEEQLKEFNDLDYMKYDITDFTLPILHSSNKSKVVSFGNATYDITAEKKKGKYGKVITVLLLTFLNIGITFMFQNVVDAIFNLIITASALMFSYFWNYSKPKFKLLNQIPNEIKMKENLYKSFKTYQKGGIELKNEIKIDEVVDEETEIIE